MSAIGGPVKGLHRNVENAVLSRMPANTPQQRHADTSRSDDNLRRFVAAVIMVYEDAALTELPYPTIQSKDFHGDVENMPPWCCQINVACAAQTCRCSLCYYPFVVLQGLRKCLAVCFCWVLDVFPTAAGRLVWAMQVQHRALLAAASRSRARL